MYLSSKLPIEDIANKINSERTAMYDDGRTRSHILCAGVLPDAQGKMSLHITLWGGSSFIAYPSSVMFKQEDEVAS